MSTGDTWRLGRRPALDGLRGVAALLVVLGHGRLAPGGGSIGVAAFFTLSGFLITTLLLEEHAKHGRVSLLSFYRRRALRLMPAALVFAAVMLGVVLLVAPSAGAPSGAVGMALYSVNWMRVGGDGLGVFRHTWSLSVEEQFYLVWPVIFAVAARRGRSMIAGVALVGALASVAAKFALWDGGAGYLRVYYGSDTRADGLLLGCLLAVGMHGAKPRRNFPALGGALVLSLLLMLGSSPGVEYLLLPSWVALVTVAAIWCLERDSVPAAATWLAARPLVAVGRRSYGLYLWHYPVMVLFLGRLDPLPHVVQVAALAGVSWVLTLLSWRFVEAPFLRRRALSEGGGPTVRGLEGLPANNSPAPRHAVPVAAALHDPAVGAVE